MKRILILCAFTLIAFSAFTPVAQAQKSFKGIVTYTLTYSGTIDAATAAQQPKLMTIFVLGNKTKTQIIQGPVTFEAVVDGDNKSKVVLLDIMGQKVYYKQSTEEIEKEMTSLPLITYSDETKTIAGYVCKKATSVTKDEDDNEVKVDVWYTADLGGEAINYGDQFQGLKGFPMEYEMSSEGIITKISATEVKKGKVKETDFLIPSDYVELSPEEKAEIMQQLK